MQIRIDGMNQFEHIRVNVFGCKSQAEFAEVIGVSQPTISRIEAGQFQPNQAILRAIRQAAMDRGHDWSDSLLFELPT